MTKKIVVFVVIVFCVALTVWLRDMDEKKTETAETHPLARVATTVTHEELPAPDWDAMDPSSSTQVQDASQSTSIEVVKVPLELRAEKPLRETSTEGSDVQQDSVNVPQAGESPQNPDIAAEAFDPRSVIGRPMPMSNSVLIECARFSKEECAHDLQPIQQLAQEPRDVQWAVEAEARIREFIQTYENPVTIRALECRQTGCIAEVASSYGHFAIGASPAFAKLAFKDGLNPRLFLPRGYETDPSSGAKITVTYWRFERH